MQFRRKTTTLKYDPPYTKKPAKTFVGTGGANHQHSVEEVSLDGSSKLVYANQAGLRDKTIHGRRYTAGGTEDEQAHSEKGILKKHGYGLIHGDKWADELQADNLELITTQDTTLTSTGVAASDVAHTLKSLNGYHEDILEALRNAASHRGTGTGNTPVGSGSLSEEMLRKTLQECTAAQLSYVPEPYKRPTGSKTSSRENVCDQTHAVLVESGSLGLGHAPPIMHHHRSQHQLHQPIPQPQHTPIQIDDDDGPSTGPLRIRNLEDLIRQLEHHSSRHMSPSGSEDIRLAEADPERHYRVDSSAACSESSQGSTQQITQTQKTATIHPSYSSRCRQRTDDEPRYPYGGAGTSGRYRHPSTTTNRHSTHQSHSPHTFGHHSHHSHAHGHASHGPHSSHHSSRTHLHQEDVDGIYETADHHDRSVLDTRLEQRDVPDSESDEFIQAQQQLARWASEDVVSVVVLDQTQSGTMSDSQQSSGVGQTSTTNTVIHHPHQHQYHGDHHQSLAAGTAAALPPSSSIMGLGSGVAGGLNPNQRDYYPSPPSTETESSGSAIQPLTRRIPMQQDTNSHQQMQLHQHQLQLHQQQQGDTSSSNNSQAGQMMENGRYPEYKH